MKKILVKTENRKYPIIIGSDLIKKMQNIFNKNSIDCQNYFFIIDSRIPNKLISPIKKQFKNKKIIFYKFN